MQTVYENQLVQEITRTERYLETIREKSESAVGDAVPEWVNLITRLEHRIEYLESLIQNDGRAKTPQDQSGRKTVRVR